MISFTPNWSYDSSQGTIFEKLFFFEKSWSGGLGGGGTLKTWRKAHPSTPNEKKHSLLTFKHFLFIFMTFFPPFLVHPLWSDFSRKRYQKNVFFKQKLFSFPMKNSVNPYSVEPVSFECIDEK